MAPWIMVIIGTGNGLSPIRCQTITWTSANILSLMDKLNLNMNQIIIIFIEEINFKNVVCKMSAILFRLQCEHNFCVNRLVNRNHKPINLVICTILNNVMWEFINVNKENISRYIKYDQIVNANYVSKIICTLAPPVPGRKHTDLALTFNRCTHKNAAKLKTVYLLLTAQDKMAAIFQTTFSNVFSWMKMYEFQLRFHWCLFLRVQLTIFQYWLRQWLGAGQATSHYLRHWCLVYRHIYVSLSLNELTQALQWPRLVKLDFGTYMRHSASMS